MKPYVPDTLPLKAIAWDEYISLIGRANAELARYDGLLQSIINPSILLSPLITQEAVLSSRIEGTQASMEEVLEYEADSRKITEPSKQADIQEIINYRKAMNRAVQDLDKRPICLNLLRDLHAILLDSVRGKSKAAGEFRRIQNYIGPPGCTIEDATFVPPSADQIMPALDNWEKYVHLEEKDSLVQLAIVKAQFELIHPFLDGNGRIGRMLVPLFLYEKKLLFRPMFYLSAYFESNREAYYYNLQGISENGNWHGWIKFFLEAVIEQSQANAQKTQEILNLYEKMKEAVPKITHSQYSIQAIDAMFMQPIFQSADFVERSGIPKDTAFRILSALKKEELVLDLRARSGRQGAIMMFVDLLQITEAGR